MLIESEFILYIFIIKWRNVMFIESLDIIQLLIIELNVARIKSSLTKVIYHFNKFK